jgi:hypothetical protein
MDVSYQDAHEAIRIYSRVNPYKAAEVSSLQASLMARNFITRALFDFEAGITTAFGLLRDTVQNLGKHRNSFLSQNELVQAWVCRQHRMDYGSQHVCPNPWILV